MQSGEAKAAQRRKWLVQQHRKKRQIGVEVRRHAVRGSGLRRLAPVPIVAFDFELAGAADDDIIEIGAIRLSPGGSVDSFRALMRPRTYLTKVVQKMTGLTKETLKDKPPLARVLPRFMDFIGDSVLLGHAIGENDLISLNLALERNPAALSPERRRAQRHTGKGQPKACYRPPFIDTVYLAKSLLSGEVARYNLAYLLARAGWQQKKEHRAYDDAIATYLLFEHLMDRWGKAPGWLPHLADSEAGRQLILGRFEKAEETVEESEKSIN